MLDKLHSPSNAVLLQNYNAMMGVFVPFEMNDQMMKDIRRTYSRTKYFNEQTSAEGFHKLHRLLVAISAYKKIGYVQGINFIAASLLWHCNEEFAFFIVAKLFDKLKMEDLYADNLLSVERKCNDFFELVLKQASPEIHLKLTQLGVVPTMVLAEWIITLGFSSVSIEKHINILNGLLEKGWNYFFGVLLKYFRTLYPFFENKDFADTLNVIKNNSDPNIQRDFGIHIDWDHITQL